MTLKKVKLNEYLKNFVDFCKKRYGKNLIAIGIYGSYAWGYFNKEKSDYDVYLVFTNKLRDEKRFLRKKFAKIAIHYFYTANDMLQSIKEGHWNSYITFLTSAKMLYYSPAYERAIIKIRKIDFVNNLSDTKRIEWKAEFDKDIIKKSRGYNGVKYALPALRSRLQLLTYLRFKKLIWDLSKVIKLNNDFLDLREQKFLMWLDSSVKKRKQNFGISEQNKAMKLLDKISNHILNILKPN